MTERSNPLDSIAQAVRRGLGVVHDGVDQMSSVITSADSSLQQLDNSLTGRPPATAAPAATTFPANPGPPMQQGEVAARVVGLARQGQQAAQESGSLYSQQVTEPFRQLMGLLFEPSTARGLSSDTLQDILPSASQTVQTGLKGLRGSLSLIRLANGSATPDDLVSVIGLAESLMGQVQGVSQAVPPAPNPAPAPVPAAAPAKNKRRTKAQIAADKAEQEAPRSASGKALSPYNLFVRDFRQSHPGSSITEAAQAWQAQKPGGAAPARTRSPRKKKASGVPTENVVFAKAVAEEVNDPGVTQAAADLAAGKITEPQYQEKLGEVVDARGLDFDEVVNRAVERVHAAA